MTPAQALSTARAAWWAARSIRRAHSVNLAAPVPEQLPQVPTVSPAAIDGVKVSLRLARSSCLTRPMILQAWLLAHGDARNLVIGVTRPGEQFGAHAWLEGEPPCHGSFHELTQRPPR